MTWKDRIAGPQFATRVRPAPEEVQRRLVSALAGRPQLIGSTLPTKNPRPPKGKRAQHKDITITFPRPGRIVAAGHDAASFTAVPRGPLTMFDELQAMLADAAKRPFVAPQNTGIAHGPHRQRTARQRSDDD